MELGSPPNDGGDGEERYHCCRRFYRTSEIPSWYLVLSALAGLIPFQNIVVFVLIKFFCRFWWMFVKNDVVFKFSCFFVSACYLLILLILILFFFCK